MRLRVIISLGVFLWCSWLFVDAYGEDAPLCLGCHGTKGMSKTLSKGEELSLYVDPVQMRESAHGDFDCSVCHQGFSAEDHPEKTFSSKRGYSKLFSGACTNCHTDFKGIHSVLSGGEVGGVVCTDCHTAHNVKPFKFSQESQYCLVCHSQGIHLNFGDGAQLPLQVDPAHIEQSIHRDLTCSDCHSDFSPQAHPQRNFKSKRDYTVASSQVCKTCHFEQYTETLESVHSRLPAQGNEDAPVCLDCHGSHAIVPARETKALTPPICAKCHEDKYSAYKKSVHGAARISEHNADAPTCSDCHLAHKISDPRTAEFHLLVPEICGRCHSEEKLMKKYGISSSVVKTYNQDFHGITLGLYKQKGESKRVAVCTDCHGIHDIAKPPSPNSPEVHAYLAKKCQACHLNAPDNFSASWIPHYEASFGRAPVVFAINLLYKIFIPLMVVGLFLQILLHIWRLVIKR